MPKSLQAYIKEACEGLDGVSFRESYSGRGMYGAQCIGVVGSMSDCIRAAQRAALRAAQDQHFDKVSSIEEAPEADDPIPEEARQLDTDGLENAQMDSMGFDMILYWPDLKPLPDEEEADSAEDQG